MKVRELRTYVNHCDALLRDIDYVIEDYQQEKNITTWYAVDFSEIFNYVLPYASHERAPFADGWGEDPLRQFYVLSQFFGRRNIVLPEPYAVELRGFFDRLLMNEYDYVEDVIGPTMKEFKPLLLSDDVNDLRELAARTELTDAEVQRTIRFFELHAPGLVALARGADLLPLDRLKKLLSTRPFIVLEKFAPGAIANVEEQSVRRIFNILSPRRVRRFHASYLDALAVEHVRMVNEVLVPQNKRLLLVTRSAAMMAAVETLSREPEWGGAGKFVRHPRSFSAAYRPAGRDDAFFMDELKLRRESLDVFVSAARESIKSEAAEEDLEISSVLRELLEKLQTNWTRVEALATAFVEEGELPIKASAAQKSPRRLTHELLTFLRNPNKEIYKEALSRVREIFNELRRGRALLGVEMHQTAHEDSKGMLLYSIDFESPLLQARMRELASLWRVDIEDAAALWDFRDDGSIAEYERMLAMSISLGAINHWNVAARYIEFALLLGKQSNISQHEGQFFRAVCLRKNSGTPDERPRRKVRRIREALAALDEAESTRLKKHGSGRDARYMKERAVLWMEWRNTFRASESETDIPTIEGIADLLLDSLRVAGHDEKLRIQIYNNLCYLYVDFADPIDRENAQKYLKLLTELLKEHGSTWPSFIEDTVIWAEFQLRPPNVSPQLLDHWAARLRTISMHLDLTRFERDEIQRHLSHVATAMISSQSEKPEQNEAEPARELAAE